MIDVDIVVVFDGGYCVIVNGIMCKVMVECIGCNVMV